MGIIWAPVIYDSARLQVLVIIVASLLAVIVFARRVYRYPAFRFLLKELRDPPLWISGPLVLMLLLG